jgi:hypothetical protein
LLLCSQKGKFFLILEYRLKFIQLFDFLHQTCLKSQYSLHYSYLLFSLTFIQSDFLHKKRTAITTVLISARRCPTLTGGNPQLPSAQKLNFRVQSRRSMSGGSLRQLHSVGPRVYHTLRASFPRFLDLLAPDPSRDLFNNLNKDSLLSSIVLSDIYTKKEQP